MFLPYTYGAAERLISSGAAANPTNYRYNGDGVRVSKATGLSSNSYVWDAGQDLLQEGGSSTSYIYGPGGMLVEQIQASTPYYYHADQLGSVRAITNSSGSVVSTYTYDAYGNTSTSTGTVANPFKYSGQYTDSETGFLYLRARYYDPATQQFLSVDPTLASTEQAYAYTGGSPTNGTDPSGLWLQYDNGEDRAYDFRLAFMMDQMGGGEFGLLGRYSMPYGRMGKPSIDDFTLKEIMESRVASVAEESVAAQPASEGTCSIGGPYSDLEDPPGTGPGKDFTRAQKDAMLNANQERNGGIVKSDVADDPYNVLIKPAKSKAGVTPPQNEWQVDHIVPKSQGGDNSYSNGQLTSRKYNRDKWDR